jgi:hypothetical protein
MQITAAGRRRRPTIETFEAKFPLKFDKWREKEMAAQCGGAERRCHKTIPRMKREGRLSSQAASAFAAWAYRSLCGVVQRPPEGSAPKPGPAGHGPW